MEDARSKKMIRMEAYEDAVMLRVGAGDSAEASEAGKIEEADAFEWMDRIEAAAGRGGVRASDGAFARGAEILAAEMTEAAGAGVTFTVEDVYAELGSDGAEVVLERVLYLGLVSDADPAVQAWAMDDVTGTDGRAGRPLTLAEAGMDRPELDRPVDGGDGVVRGRSGGSAGGGHWWD